MRVSQKLGRKTRDPDRNEANQAKNETLHDSLARLFHKINVDITAASGWLQQLVRPLHLTESA